MKLDLKTKFKEIFSIEHKKAIILTVIGVGIVVTGLNYKIIKNKFFASKTEVLQKTATVKRGNLQVLVSGSGPISFTNSSKLYSKINATVTTSNFKEGDKVKAGDIIYEFDVTDAQTTIDTNQNNLAQSQVAAKASDGDVGNLTIKAPFAGQVSSITLSKGDTVAKGGIVLTVADTSKLTVLLTYNAADIGKVTLDQSADVFLTSIMQAVKGKVTYISNQPAATSAGGKLYTVEIQMNNPGALISGMIANADIQTSQGAVSSTAAAALNYLNKQAVTSLTGGTIESINVKENQKVSSGQTLVKIKNDEVMRSQQTSNLKIQNSQSQVNSNLKQLDKYKIIAPFDGVITKLSFKVGDSVKPGDEVADVSDPTMMQFDVPVDELDVAKIVVGQKTNISVDAFPNTVTNPVKGEVIKIVVEGTSVSGVTTFPVTIKVDGSLDILKGGMNANAEVEVSNKDNILYVPMEAITTVNGKSYVMVKGTNAGSTLEGIAPNEQTSNSSTKKNNNSAATVNTKIVENNKTSGTNASKKQSYYAGSMQTEVKVGSYNSTDIEITSGLKEGDMVVLPQTKAAQTKASGRIGGGAPSGGPGGGM